MKKIILISLLLVFSNCMYAQWKLVDSTGTLYPFPKIDCADNLNCIVAVSSSATQMLIHKSTDGGYSWNTIFFDEAIKIYEYDEETGDSVWVDTIMPKYNKLLCIDYVTPNFVICGHEEGQITISRDGGHTWDSTNLDIHEDIENVQFVDKKNGYILSNHYILKSNNSGKDWKIINTSEIINNPNGIQSYIANFQVIKQEEIVCLIYDRANEDKKVFKTAYTLDDGANWKKSTTISPYGSWPGLDFLDIQTGWVAGRQNIPGKDKHYKDLIYKTTDSGQTWIKQLVTAKEPEGGLRDIKMFKNNTGIAWGSFGKIWRTTNGGDNWINDTSFTFFSIDSFSDFAFPNNNTNNFLATVEHWCQIWMYEDPSSVKKHSDPKLKIYPNPAREVLKITSEELTGSNIRAVITNSAGMKIIEKDLINIQNGEIDISGLPPGFYFLNIYSGGEIINKPFAVVR